VVVEKEAFVVIDNLTNDVRGMRTKPNTTLEEVASRLRRLVKKMGRHRDGGV
jgi:predicted nucleic acid-binding Zn ribbon protein